MLTLAIRGHVVHCIIPYGVMRFARYLCYLMLTLAIRGHVVHCIIAYGAMWCIALYHMGACGALRRGPSRHEPGEEVHMVHYIISYGAMWCIA